MVLQFRYPLAACPRVAVLGLPTFEGPALPLLEAETVAAPARLVMMLPAGSWEPHFPIVVFTGAAYGFLSEEDRDILWRRWRVPVFEQLLSPTLTMLAEECEAHEGLHLLDGDWELDRGELIVNGGQTGVSATAIKTPCPCGSTAPRLVNVSACERARSAHA